jgi:tRNA threonylcarbamoyl adenosine modification protein (Sua5/YciO/YrdC/YwlC family)
MNIIVFNESNQRDVALRVSAILKNGGIAVVPFDTVYGFICDARNDSALEQIFGLKGRDTSKSIGLAMDSVSAIEKIAHVPNISFVKDRIPGKFTFVLKAKDSSLSKYCYRSGTIGARVPASNLILEIASLNGGIIAQTSANKSGMANCWSLDDFKDQFSLEEINSIDIILDGGTLEKSQPSRIFDLTSSGAKEIER